MCSFSNEIKFNLCRKYNTQIREDESNYINSLILNHKITLFRAKEKKIKEITKKKVHWFRQNWGYYF